ncbi:MAG: ribosomal-processing cysteine protease Prp [Sporomusaceae bacterium]|nr:ribosomal-processing cysteine protease Prp [Sporomusaceae bacterium]
MIKIEIVRNSDQAMVGFRVTGHANTAPHGHDIVCAGISALTQTTVLGLDRQLKKKVHLEIANGNLKMDLLDNPDALTDAILETMLIGLTEIGKQHPKSIRILERRR